MLSKLWNEFQPECIFLLTSDFISDNGNSLSYKLIVGGGTEIFARVQNFHGRAGLKPDLLKVQSIENYHQKGAFVMEDSTVKESESEIISEYIQNVIEKNIGKIGT